MNLREVHKRFSTDEQCLEYIQQMRWPDGVVRCPTCGGNKVKRVERTADAKGRNKRGWFFLCTEKTCLNQFSPTSGTIFHDTHLPLIVWFAAIALMQNAKKGISAKQLQRDLGIGGYKTAWYLNHRIREAMGEADAPKLGGIVEVDETYIGGKAKGKGTGYGRYNKQTVFGVRQRGGSLRLIQVKKAKADVAKNIIESHVSPDVELLMTDDSTIYPAALKTMGAEFQGKHRTINHISKQYVNGVIHTNTVENAFSLLKRGIVGNFHRVSIKHLQRYLNEFSYRFNRREAKAEDAFIETVRRLAGFKPLPFGVLTAEKA
jgi:transposase-like protein